MSSPHPLPPKKEVALALLERSSVHVHLDPRAQGVSVPAWFKKQPQLVLQIGLNMPVPIPDLRLDDEGMTCTLSFSRQPFYCIVPWTSVFAMVGDDGRGMVWPDDVPPEIASQAKQAEASSPAVAPKRPAAKRVSPIEVAPVPRAAQTEASASVQEKSDDKGDEKGEKPVKARKSRAKKSRAGAAATTVEASADTSRQAGSAAEPELRPVLVAVPSSREASREAPSRDDRREERVEKRADKRGGARPEPREAPRPEAARARFEKAEKNAEKAPAAKTPERIERPQPHPQSRPMGGPPKVKRELPPYLRVVK